LNGLINGIEDVYDGLRKEEKIQYSKRVVKQMQESGARFLKLDEVSGLWAVAIQAEAHKRVSKAFGNRRRYRKSG
jgi:chromosome segregation and condensation protein ScpB